LPLGGGEDEERVEWKRVVVVLSGGNLTVDTLREILAG